MDPRTAGIISSGGAFADLSSWRKVEVSGADALPWLDDLVSADLSSLAPGQANRSLLLSPTGRVRAGFTVTRPGERLLLVQDPSQRSIQELLSPYVLSSDVSLEDRTQELALLALPGAEGPPQGVVELFSSPSCLGPGTDVFTSEEQHGALLRQMERSLMRLDDEELDEWRVLAGSPRLGVDVTEEDLPQEGALDDVVAFDKGCYLGQEAVAKVRNLGHPRRVLLHLEAASPVSPGEVILADGREAGLITSAASLGDRSVVLARVGWASRNSPLRTAGGVELREVNVQSPV